MGLGGVAGWVVGGAAPEAISGGSLASLAAVVGSVGGGVLGLCLFRPAVALAAALSCGAVAGLGAALWLGAVTAHEVTATAAPSLEAQARVLLRESVARRGMERVSIENAPGEGGSAAEIGGVAWVRVTEEVGRRWGHVAPQSRMRIVGITVLGALAGLIVGGLGPRRVVSVLSAAVGAALLIGLAPSALSLAGFPVLRDPLAWVGSWALLALVGAVVQLAALPRRSAAAQAQNRA